MLIFIATLPVLHDDKVVLGCQLFQLLGCVSCEVCHDVHVGLEKANVWPHRVSQLRWDSGMDNGTVDCINMDILAKVVS